MRSRVKEKMLALLDSMLQSHRIILHTEDKGEILELLEDCQQAAIVVGETIEKEASDHREIISLLEKYCAELFLYAQNASFVETDIGLNRLVGAAIDLLRQVPVIYQVVFMPYKAAMWDSLESIWEACRRDERCECLVMPIPYFELDVANKKVIPCYDGELFPEEVPITYYKEFNLGFNYPDIIYIHNPYDGENYVTSIHPSYYSDKLKQYTGNLVYVPYYVTSGFFDKNHLYLPVCRNMDYMIIQSEYAKSMCRDAAYYDEILPLGSPKLDRIIAQQGREKNIPEEWRPIIEDKKVLMLNTSINCLLNDDIYLLGKLKTVFELIKNNRKIALLWRPHPLLEATMQSMRPQLLPRYNQLKEYFVENEIGILDNTPDITNTVVIADGYLGEEGTSVINLFGAAGKPIFILNNYIKKYLPEKEKKRLLIGDMVKQKEKLYFTSLFCNGLFELDENTKRIYYIGWAETQPRWSNTYSGLTAVERKLYLAPFETNCSISYHLDKNKFEELVVEGEEEAFFYKYAVSYKYKVFYLSTGKNIILEYDTENNIYFKHRTCMEQFGSRAEIQEVISGYLVLEQSLWIIASYTNKILQFNMEDGSYTFHTVGKENEGYTSIAADKDCLWLGEVKHAMIVRWNRLTGHEENYAMPQGFLLWTGCSGRKCPHAKIIDMGKWIVTVPGYSNKMIKLNKDTGVTSFLIPDFWESSGESSWCHPMSSYTGWFADKKSEAVLWVQRTNDGAVAIVNVEEETYEIFYPALSDIDYDLLLGKGKGFEKKNKISGFFKKESRFFSLEEFIDDVAENRLLDIRERQIQELSTLAANLDGTCGMKVHEYMMCALEERK